MHLAARSKGNCLIEGAGPDTDTRGTFIALGIFLMKDPRTVTTETEMLSGVHEGHMRIR